MLLMSCRFGIFFVFLVLFFKAFAQAYLYIHRPAIYLRDPDGFWRITVNPPYATGKITMLVLIVSHFAR